MKENGKARITVYLTPEAEAIVNQRRERDGLSLTGAVEIIIREWYRDRYEAKPMEPIATP